MKQLIISGGILLILLLAGFWFITGKLAEDHGLLIGMAVGPEGNKGSELNIVVSIGMVRAEGAPIAPSGAQQWDKWIDLHFDIRSEAGERVQLTRLGHSQMIHPRKALNPEFYLRGYLKPGQTYTLDYKPRTFESKLYRRAVTVPAGGLPYERTQFETIEGA